MGYFSNKLSEIVERAGSAGDFAAQCGLARSSISRFMTGKMTPDANSLTRICQQLTTAETGDILEAYILDSIPPDLRQHINVEPRARVVSEEQVLPVIYFRLKPEARRLLDEIGRLFLEDPEIYETFRRTVSLISSRWAQTQDTDPSKPSPSATAKSKDSKKYSQGTE